MLSRRAVWNTPENRLTVARRAHGGPLFDLTEANPTRAGIAYPTEELSEIYARAAREPYEPDPRGIISAREAVAAHLGCGAGDLVLTASTSEAYSFLFKLLTDPGDAILTATPSYPLLEHLSQLELIEQQSFPLELQKRWEFDPTRIVAGARTRAIVVVNPNNPTGSYVAPEEQDLLARFGLPVISDEVFLDYPLEGSGTTFVRDDLLTFTLGGLSKSAGLPHLKLGWIRVSGPAGAKRRALEALEMIADNFLSVSTPVQAALPGLLGLAPAIRAAIAARTSENLGALARAVATSPGARLLPVEGGWSAVVRVPRVESDEELALRLLGEHGVVVHPGYFFDFEGDGFVVVSLLTRPDVFLEGVGRLARALPR